MPDPLDSSILNGNADTVLQVRDMHKAIESRDGTRTPVSRGVTFDLGQREFVSIVGPSGAGKTTLLRVVGGLSRPTSGEVLYRGAPIDGIPESLSIVFQEYNKSLFPWLSVEKNVAKGARRLGAKAVGPEVAHALGRVGLAGFESRYPWELSGGMQQRVALARALISDPAVLLLDEPFASVDALTRMRLEDRVLELWETSEFAALLVTHDVEEAVYLSDRVLVLSARPSTIIEDIRVELPRPRSQDTRSLPEFTAFRDRVRAEVLSAGQE